MHSISPMIAPYGIFGWSVQEKAIKKVMRFTVATQKESVAYLVVSALDLAFLLLLQISNRARLSQIPP